MTETGPIMADTTCPICEEACKVLLPETAGNHAFACVVHHDFEVTQSAMLKGKLVMVAHWEAALRKAKARAGIGRPCIEVGDFEERAGRTMDQEPEEPQRPDEGILFRLAMIAVLVLAILSPFVMIYIVWIVVLRIVPGLWNLLPV
jgi:hypothetical protein